MRNHDVEESDTTAHSRSEERSGEEHLRTAPFVCIALSFGWGSSLPQYLIASCGVSIRLCSPALLSMRNASIPVDINVRSIG